MYVSANLLVENYLQKQILSTEFLPGPELGKLLGNSGLGP